MFVVVVRDSREGEKKKTAKPHIEFLCISVDGYVSINADVFAIRKIELFCPQMHFVFVHFFRSLLL